MAEYVILAFWLSAGALLYALGVYPLTVYLVSRLRPVRPGIEVEPLPCVSVIIPARDEEAVLREKLHNTLSLDYPADRLEIIVASDGSVDSTVEIAEGFSDRAVRVLAFPDWRGKASALNDAIQQASAEVLCLCDANVIFRPDALRRMVCRLTDSWIGAVTGDVRLASGDSNFGHGESVYYRAERFLQAAESRLGSVMGVDGGMYVVRKDLFRHLPADTVLDDFAMSMAVIQRGRRVVFAADAVATENATATASHEFRRRIRVAAGAVQSIRRRQWPPLARPVELWQYVSHKLLRWLGPLWLTVLLASNVLLWNQGTLYRAALLGQIGLYAAAVLATVSVRIRKTRFGGIVFYFVMSHVAMGIGFVRGLLWKQQGTWKRTERKPIYAADQELQLPERVS